MSTIIFFCIIHVMSEAATNTLSRVDLRRVEVKAPLKYQENKGLQAALICAKENFIVGSEANQKTIENRLKGSRDERWDYKLFDRASRRETKEKGIDLATWEKQMVGWIKDLEGKNKTAYKSIKDVLGGIMGVEGGKFDFDDRAVQQIVEVVYKQGGGIKSFVEAAVKAGNLNSKEGMQAVKDLAGSFFGTTSGEAVAQMIGLEQKINSGKNSSALASELIEEGNKIKNGNNPDAGFVVKELKRLLDETREDIGQNEVENPVSKIGAKQTIGGREEQQDFILTKNERLPRGIKAIAIVADGHKKEGQKASRFAAQHFESKLVDILTKASSLPMEQAIRQAVQFAHKQLLTLTPEGGTTLNAVIQFKDKAYVVNVGDSKTHLIRGAEAKKITTDHNLGGEEANVLTRSLGDGGKLSTTPDIFRVDLKEGDRLVLSCDGLRLTPGQIGLQIAGRSPREAAEALIQNSSKSGDNVSSVVLQI